MKTLRQLIVESEERRVGIGHFNASGLMMVKAIFEAAVEVNLPVVVGFSEGEREFVGAYEAATLIKFLREKYNFPIFINADHTHSIEKAKEAALAGYDQISFDLSKLPLEENIKRTKETVRTIRSINADILIEGEIGYIGSSSEVVKERPSEIELTTAEEAKQFVEETGIDILAPAVGNMHGILAIESPEGRKIYVEQRLNLNRIREIKSATKLPLTLHGGSGTTNEDFIGAIESGINIIHISTELRLRWRQKLEEMLKNYPDEIAPYKILSPVKEAIKEIVKEKLKLLSREKM